MKKAGALIAALMLLLSLAACSSGNSADAIEKQLQGTWVLDGDVGATYIFEDGRFSCESFVADVSLGVKAGSYEIGENAIALNYDNGVEGDLEYTSENGELTLYFSNDEALVKQ